MKSAAIRMMIGRNRKTLRAISLNFGNSSSRMPRMPSLAASKSTMK
jgi:hypothetical protein